MNFEVAEKALQYLEAEPRRFDMKVGIARPLSVWAKPLEDAPPCGTLCCFAGAIVLTNSTDENDRELAWPSVAFRAIRLLEVGVRDSADYFSLDYWPMEYRSAYLNAKTQRERVGALRAYIESLKEKAA